MLLFEQICELPLIPFMTVTISTLFFQCDHIGLNLAFEAIFCAVFFFYAI